MISVHTTLEELRKKQQLPVINFGFAFEENSYREIT